MKQHQNFLGFLSLIVLGLGQVLLSAQQAGTSRLLAAGIPIQIPPVSTTRLVYEVDPGDAAGTLLPQATAAGNSFGFPVTRTYDPIGGRIFIYNGGSNHVLLTIDAATGNVIHSVTPVFEPAQMEYEVSTSRLLAFVCPTGVNGANGMTLVELNPQNGSVVTIGQIPNTLGVPYGNRWTAVDPATNRLFYRHGLQGQPIAIFLAVIDTLTGVVLSDSAWPCAFCIDMFDMLEFDTMTGQLYGFSRVGVGGTSGLVIIDPATAVPTPVGSGNPLIIPGSMPVLFPSALDVARREYYTIARYNIDPLGSSFLRLFTFNLDTGNLIGDPVVPMFYNGFVVDTVNVPMRGRVTLGPNMCLVPGTTRTVTFESLAHSGDYYLPFVSCTPGSYAVPGSNLVVPLGFDFCTNLYLSQAAPTFFNLTSGNGVVGMLSPGGLASGTVSLPATTPPGLNFRLSITFLTINSSLQWSGLHGMTTFNIRS